MVAGATDPDIEGVEVLRRPARTVSRVEMLEAGGYLLGTRPTSATFGRSQALFTRIPGFYLNRLDDRVEDAGSAARCVEAGKLPRPISI